MLTCELSNAFHPRAAAPSDLLHLAETLCPQRKLCQATLGGATSPRRDDGLEQAPNPGNQAHCRAEDFLEQSAHEGKETRVTTPLLTAEARSTVEIAHVVAHVIPALLRRICCWRVL